jgi:peptidoglycan hydrolase-like protein with peptidoglycan-binding domain
MVAAVQRRLRQLRYYHGVVDGVIGPQTRGAIAAFESRNGLAVDGTISRPLLDTLGLAQSELKISGIRQAASHQISEPPVFFLLSQKK